MDKKTIVFGLIIMAVLAPSALAFDCIRTTSEYAPVVETLTFICSSVESSECYVWVALDDPLVNLVNTGPGTRWTEQTYLNGFPVNGNHTIIEVQTDDWRDNTNYTIGVVCGETEKEYNYSMAWTTGNAPARGWLYVMKYASMFILTIIVILFVGWLSIWVYNSAKYNG